MYRCTVFSVYGHLYNGGESRFLYRGQHTFEVGEGYFFTSIICGLDLPFFILIFETSQISEGPCVFFF
jgi:hypothetical protein